MLSEGEVRSLLNVLNNNLKAETNPARAIAFSGGVSALEMILEEDA